MLRPPTSILLAQTSLLSSEFIFPTAYNRTSSLGYSQPYWTQHTNAELIFCKLASSPISPFLENEHILSPQQGPQRWAIFLPHSQLVTKFCLLFLLSISCSVHYLLSRLPTTGSWIAISCSQYQTLNPLFLQDSNHTDHLFKTHQ